MTTAHQQTLRAAVEGSDEALAELVRVYHDRVYRFGVRACGNGFDADDAVQQAFIRLARRPEVQRAPTVLSWLMTTVRNACLRLMRPFAAPESLDERMNFGDDPGHLAPSPEVLFERFELARQVHAAIATVPQPLREVLILRDLEGLSGEEVCAILGLSTAAMKSRLHRARDIVRTHLLEARGGH